MPPDPTADAYIALGANLGDPLAALRRAAAHLGTLGQVAGVSALYRTAPVGGPPGQPDYLNAAAHLRTTLSAETLLAALHDLEAAAGRERHERWEARTLDLDLITHGDRVSAHPALTLPHPRAWDRPFVLAPLHDLNPDLRHPVTGETVRGALSRLGMGRLGMDGVQRVGGPWLP
ncbi:2-amino-4-hydroxy-6-hydroxymethyldihydropteridine diphosphokinase [Deinococcus knuensis]|uniref:2-amino-4-hydroxy-6-hydroxymethyldihydropteridine diphosphokinase n=1 Tax=Deinococcus knuensis TaxID=1837380 RepID=A0ABQ2SKV2_9DEIO|nr:2-amino-4-hydroxy-6-hydroxymethyldihydropteridine diphosphokinase [Deinococcus knuensis]GGS32592.1 2-amino-4-hydroxy-6-hydroxymethyldihydropteridine diphosphokinase [Deinococcus knuensis]